MRVIDVDVGVGLPEAFAGLRRLLSHLGDLSPKLIERSVKEEPEVWNRLFPGKAPAATTLEEITLSPSERRLHRESEQVFRVATVCARVILDVLKELGAELHLHNAGASDLVSLRTVMRAMEWSRLESERCPIQLDGWAARSRYGSDLFEPRRNRFLDGLRKRMRVGTDSVGGQVDWMPPSVDLEGKYLRLSIQKDADVPTRLAAAVLAIRACFFSTNYEGAMLAAESASRLLDQNPDVSGDAVKKAWDGLDTGFITAAIEVDRGSLGGAPELRTLLHRCIGVVQSFCGENDESMASFAAGLQQPVSPEHRSHLHMFRALSLTKRIGHVDGAQAEGFAGVKLLEGRESPEQALHEAWLRNVLALTFFQQNDLKTAVAQETRAIQCLAGLRSASATHLKINLITNMSVIQQTAGRMAQAIETWRKFENNIEHWDDNFHKHHRYRLAALYRTAGDFDTAFKTYEEAYRRALKLKDEFNSQVIAADVGITYLRQGKKEQAAEWFEKAATHAQSYGDPFRLAESLVGLTVAKGGHDFGEALRLAAMTSTFPEEAEKLSGALRKGDGQGALALLPKLRTKLNRPFDGVNLY